MTIRVEKSETERTRHAETTIICRASPEANDYLGCAPVGRVSQHFTDSKSRGESRIPFVRRELTEPSGSTHFHDGQPRHSQPRITTLLSATERVAGCDDNPFASTSRANSFSCSFAAICQSNDL